MQETGIRLYRGLKPHQGKTEKEFAEQYRSGTLFTGFNSAFGNGIYFLSNRNLVEQSYANVDGSVILNGFLSESAYVGDYKELMKEFWKTNIPKAKTIKGTQL